MAGTISPNEFGVWHEKCAEAHSGSPCGRRADNRLPPVCHARRRFQPSGDFTDQRKV